MRRTDPRGAAAMLRGMAHRVSSEDLLEEMKMPLLVVAGGKDAIAPVEEARAVVARVPDARLEVCEDSAHLPMLEEPQRLSDILSDFAGGQS
jgi:pimeloyl-ACP methyl ester carboxylesterase